MNHGMTEKNYMIYAMKCYDNPNCGSIEEFYDDLNRLKYIKRLLNRYKRTGYLRHRLILNHIIICCNMFGNEMAVKILFFRLNKSFYSALKTIFTFLNIMPEAIYDISDTPLYNSDIPIDVVVANVLREI